MKSKIMDLTTVIGNLKTKLDSKGDVKKSNRSFGNFRPSIGATGNNEKYNPPKPGKPPTRIFGK